MLRQDYTAIDLFAGCGGCTIGLKKAGFSVAGAVEICPDASRVYALNHPDVYLWDVDITELSSAKIKRNLSLRKGQLDLLAGCPPCQGFSRMRTLNGSYDVTDERNDLIYEFERLVRDLLPRTVMLENVPGLGTDQRGRDFIAALEALEYSVSSDYLNAADFGVPQRRTRFIIIASRFGKLEFPRQARVRRTVRNAIGALAACGSSGDPIHDAPEKRSDRIHELIGMIPKDGGSRLDLPEDLQLPCHKRCNGFRDIYGRMAWDEVAPTLTTGCYNPSRGRFLHPEENRAITMREAALLQSFPRRYRFPTTIGKEKLASLIGNAIPPELVRRLGVTIYRHLCSVDGNAR